MKKAHMLSTLLCFSFLVSMFSTFGVHNASSNQLIKKINIELLPKLEKEIAQRLTRDRRLRNVVYLIAGAGTAYTAYGMLNFIKDAYVYAKTKSPNQVVHAPVVDIRKRTWGDTAKSAGLGLGRLSMSILASMVLQNIIGHSVLTVVHDDSISWAATQYAPIAPALNILKTDAIAYAKPFRTEKERAYFASMMQVTANRLVTNLQKLAAFVQYKSKKINIDGTPTVTFLIEQTNAFVDRLTQAMHSDNQRSVIEAMMAFEMLLLNELNRFAQLEIQA